MITINGKSYNGNSVTVINGKVMVDGKPADTSDDKVINIWVNGNIETLDIDYCDSLDIKGDCGTVNTQNSNVKISGNVWGSVESKNGNITCGNVGGSVKTKNGNIKHVKN